MDMERSNNTPPAANLAYSGVLCSSFFSNMKPGRQLNSASVLNSFIQIVLSALQRFCDTFACVKSMVPNEVIAVVRILCSSASPNVCPSASLSGNPYSESPIAVIVSEVNSWNSSRRSTQLTANESRHHSDPDSSSKTSPTWVVSSATPRHATGNAALLSGLVTKNAGDMFVHAVDEMPMPVIAHGTAVTDEINLPNVWLVPGLTANLVSICQLVEMGYSVEFGRGMCYIRNSALGAIIGKAHLRKGGLYVLDFLKVPLGV